MSTPNIESIYAAGITVVTTSPTYSPVEQQKTWVRTLQTGESPSDDYVYSYAIVDNTEPAPYVRWLDNVITKGAAAVANIEPSGYILPAGVTQATGAVPVPMDQTLIPAGYTLTGTPFGLLFVSNSQPVTTGATDTEEQAIKAELDEVAEKLGVPVVPVTE
jgi:hypothetical protein